MSRLEASAERQRLEALLEVAPDRLAFLDRRSPEQIRAFRHALSDAFFERHRESLERLAAVARFLPARATARLAESSLGASLAAAVASALEPATAIPLVRRLSTPFLARVARRLEPARSAELLRALPADVVVPIVRELLEVEDFPVMGQFVDALSHDALEAAISAIPTDEALLRVGFFAENRTALSQILGALPDARVLGLFRAAHENDRWQEALTILAHVEPRSAGRIVDLVAGDGSKIVSALWAGAIRERALAVVYRAVATASDDARKAFHEALAAGDAETRRHVAETLHGTDCAGVLAALPGWMQNRMAQWAKGSSSGG